MDWLATLYAAPLYAVATLSVVLAGYTWHRRGTSGAGAMTVFLLALATWSAGAALEISASGLPAKIFWSRVQYLGIVAVPPAWLVFVLRYTGQRRWLAPGRVVGLCVLPFVTWVLFLTNGTHGLMWSEVRINGSLSFPALEVVEYGPWFWVHSAYSYALMFASVLLLVSALLRRSRLYRVQGAVFLVALLVPLLANAVYIFGFSPIPNLDPTPFAFSISGVLAVWGLLRFRLLDLIPVARDAVIEGMRDGVIVVDRYDRIVDLNPAAQEVLGYPPSKAVGQDVGDLLGDREIPPRGGVGEMTLGTGDGRRDYELSLSPLRDDRGRDQGRLILLRDVTDRKRGEEELRRRAAELAVSNAELENFASFISHDLRAPLRTIEGFSRILTEDYADSLGEEGRDYLRRVREAGRRMGYFIDDLLDLSRVARGELRRDTVDLSVVARAVAEDLREAEPEREVEFVIPDELVVEADPNLIRVVIQNLLENAWKFTGPRERPRIELGVARRDGAPVYFVCDNGVGFDPNHAGRIFDTFQRLHAHDEFEGTGIGLATVQRVIHRHGGEVWAESEIGEGATFYFTL